VRRAHHPTLTPMSSQLPPEVERLVRRLVSILRAEAGKFLAPERLDGLTLEAAAITAAKDPSNGLFGYECTWRNALNERVGRLVVNSDASYYGEYDVCVRHPVKTSWFVEAVTAWGRDDAIRAEARLIAMV
jgi:hypothetical protein